MRLRFSIDLSIMRLYNGRQSLYLSLAVGQRTWFLARWDTVRVHPKPRNRDLWRGLIMTWYCGSF